MKCDHCGQEVNIIRSDYVQLSFYEDGQLETRLRFCNKNCHIKFMEVATQ